MINQEKTGFFVSNSGWVRPLLAALILMLVPKLAQCFGIMNGYLNSFCYCAALLALMFTGFEARTTDTLPAKILCHLLMIVAFLYGCVLAVHFFR